MKIMIDRRAILVSKSNNKINDGMKPRGNILDLDGCSCDLLFEIAKTMLGDVRLSENWATLYQNTFS